MNKEKIYADDVILISEIPDDMLVNYLFNKPLRKEESKEKEKEKN